MFKFFMNFYGESKKEKNGENIRANIGENNTPEKNGDNNEA